MNEAYKHIQLCMVLIIPRYNTTIYATVVVLQVLIIVQVLFL